MKKYTFTIGLFDATTEKQEINTSDARDIIALTLIDTFNIFAFTCWDCSGVYRMESTGRESGTVAKLASLDAARRLFTNCQK